MSVCVVLSLLLSKKRDVFYCKWNLICKFANPRGEILGQESVSCFIPYIEIANFKAEG